MTRRTGNRLTALDLALRSLAWTAFSVLIASPLLGSGESVPFNAVHVPPGATVTITFDVDVDDPLGVCATAISNQGSVTSTNHASVLTDDTAVGGGADPTVTGLDAVDLAITKTDGVASETPGTAITYTITASNAGPSGATGALVADTFPATVTGVTWTCVGAGGGTCAASGSGNLNQSVNLPAGGSVTFTVSGSISPSATGSLTNTATVTKPAAVLECNLANNSATDTDTLSPQADVSITKTDGVASVDAGSNTTYTITASNAGPSDAPNAGVADTFPAEITGVAWTCVGAGGGTCAASGSGNLSQSVSLPAGGSVTFTAVASVSGSATGSLVNTATVSSGAGVTDPAPGNNSATDTDTINPVADLAISKSDGTTTVVPGLATAYTIVASNAGPATATGATVADTFPAACASVTWTCVGAGGGTCTASGSGNISDSVNLPSGGSATYTAVCTTAANASGSLSNTATISGGGVSDTNAGNNSATDTDTFLPLDFGDAPDASIGAPWAYPTKLANDGARHGVNGPIALRFGAQIDTETDGQPTANADGDDANPALAPDDEDGITLPTFLVACESASVTVNASAIAKLDAFVDFNRDGDFADAGEKIFSSQALVAGANPLNFTVPCGATPTALTFARFRISTAGGLSYDGVAADGEVEDYPAAVRGLDFGDAPVVYATLFADNGARHVVTGSGPVLGAVAPDTEADGQPTAGATGDDANGVDDEDGVSFTSPLLRGQNATVTVTASAAGVLNAWLDFNGDGNWTTAGDQIFTNQALAAGANLLTFAVPATATTNLSTVSRFRIATAPGLSFNGLAQNGEVEDHAVATAAEADLSIAKSDGSATEVPGTTVTYTIVAANAGPDAATGVTVADTFPGILSGCTWTSIAAGGATGNAAAGSGNISNGGINLPSGASVTYTVTCTIAASATGTLTNTATSSVPVGLNDPVPGNNSATDADTLTPQTDLAVTKTDGSATEVPGTSVSYTIVASNAGPSDAVAASVADSFPATITGVAWTCVGAGGGTCPASGSGNIFASVNLPVGGSATFTATGTISAAATGSLANTATVAAGAGATDPTPGNNSATDTDTLTPQVDLAISKSDGSATEVPGTPVTYSIAVGNAGPSNAVAAVVADTFPAAISGVAWTCAGAGGGTCPAAGSGNLNTAVNVPVGGTVTFTATGTIASSATGTLSNTATVTAAGGTTDTNAGNNSATDTDTLTPQADLQITKDDSADPPPAGENLVYTLTVHNFGPSDAAGVAVSDPLPAAVTYVSDTCGGTNTPPWSWTIGALASGATVSCDITVSINPAPPISISNTASVTATTPDLVAGNNSDTETTQLDAIPPTVDNVDSQAGTGDGTLADCETATAPIHHLLLAFSEAMANPPGDGGANDVTNPANYLLVSAGADFDFSTTACGGAAGDDLAIPVVGVAYNGGTDTASLDLGGALAPAQYRLFACDTLTDLAGNPLDGDLDTTAGGDFLRRFRADSDDLFANAHFDCSLAGWTASAPAPGEVTWTGAEDADGADDSGAVRVTNLAPGVDTSFALAQCYDLPAAVPYQVRARLRLDAAPGVLVGLTRACTFYNGPACAGGSTTQSDTVLLGSTGGSWIPLVKTVTPPVSALSALCTFRWDTPVAAGFDSFLDAAFFGATGQLFSDGFETGDTSRWSATVP
ncbi:MAG: GEVED domain-containing protein [Thermoanaerobaculia bacterium]